jgi:hypothetical protein
MQEIIIEFDVAGEVKLEGKGFKGKNCDEAMGQFEEALGGVARRQNKPEYFQGVRTHANQRA